MKKILILILVIILGSFIAFYFYNGKFGACIGDIGPAGEDEHRHSFKPSYMQGLEPYQLPDEILIDSPSGPIAEEGIALPFTPGETLVYDVHCAGIKTGSSILRFLGEEELNGESVYHITFETELPFLKDYEDIYARKGSFLPLKIRRKIHKMGGISIEEIEEEYDQDRFTVTIKKKSAFLSNEIVIQKEGNIHNAILLTYLCRANADTVVKEDSRILLPTQEFNIRVSGNDTVDTPSGQYITDIFTSEPSKFTFYLSRDRQRLPVKIVSYAALDYAMILHSAENRL